MHPLLSFLKMGLFGMLMNGKKIHIVIEYLYYGGLLGLFYLSVYLVKNKAKSAWFTLLATVALYGGPAIVSTAVVIGVLKLLISIGEDGGNTKSVK